MDLVAGAACAEADPIVGQTKAAIAIDATHVLTVNSSIVCILITILSFLFRTPLCAKKNSGGIGRNRYG